MGAGGAQAAHRHDAPADHAPAARGGSGGLGGLAGGIARRGGAALAQPRAHRGAATPEPDRVPERGPGPAGCRNRRRGAASAGRERARLRQCQCLRSVAHAARPLHLGRPEDQPPGRWQRPGRAEQRHHPGEARRYPRAPRAWVAARLARGRLRDAHLRAGWRIRDPDLALAQPQRGSRGPAARARGSSAARPPADRDIHSGSAHRPVRLLARRQASQEAGDSGGRAAPARGDVSQDPVFLAGDHAAADAVALQHAPPPADSARGVPDLGHRSVLGPQSGG